MKLQLKCHKIKQGIYSRSFIQSMRGPLFNMSTSFGVVLKSHYRQLSVPASARTDHNPALFFYRAEDVHAFKDSSNLHDDEGRV